MRLRIVLVACAALALSVGVATAAADGGGNSDAAKACQKDGYKNWVRADQTPFKNAGDCVSYAAQGGVLTSPKTQSQIDCESAGGTFTAPGPTGYLWTCGPLGLDSSLQATFFTDCVNDGGGTGVDVTGWSSVDQLYRCYV